MAPLSYCHHHHTNEVIPEDVFVVCFECGHVYATARDLELAYEREVRKMQEEDPDAAGVPRTRPAEEIFFCQECIHDF